TVGLPSLAAISSSSSSESRSEEHTSELQSHLNLVCRLLLEKNAVRGRQELFFEDLRVWALEIWLPKFPGVRVYGVEVFFDSVVAPGPHPPIRWIPYGS